MKDPLTLADDYKLAKLAGDKPTMIAIETHVRQMAHPEALRKPGNRGTQDLKRIADQIERAYAAGQYHPLDGGRIQFNIGTLRIKCINRPGAVAWVVAKYRRGLPR